MVRIREEEIPQFKIMIVIPSEKSPLNKPRPRWWNNIERDLKDLQFKGIRIRLQIENIELVFTTFDSRPRYGR